MWNGLESRKFPRIKAECQILIEPQKGGVSLAAATENIGSGGMCVFLQEALSKFSKLKIRLDLGDGEKPIECDARVVWLVESRRLTGEFPTYDTGIEFIGLDVSARKRLEKMINSKVH